MKINNDKYNSISFKQYFLNNRGTGIKFDYNKNKLDIIDQNGAILTTVYFSSTISHIIDEDELLDKCYNKRKNAYFVYEKGVGKKDWLWHLGDLIAIDESFY